MGLVMSVDSVRVSSGGGSHKSGSLRPSTATLASLKESPIPPPPSLPLQRGNSKTKQV